MNILISGGSGFLGGALTQSLLADGHTVHVLTRGGSVPAGAQAVLWDAKTTNGWGHLASAADAVIHLAGRSLSTFPWTPAVKQSFHASRVLSGKALAQAIMQANPRPRIFLQASGINHYGLAGSPADESTPAGEDFLARLTVDWENATREVEEAGVRRVILRTSVVLGRGGGILPLMALPVRLFAGGPMGDGKFAVPWIHLRDWVGATRFLLENKAARGAYNFIAPQQTTNADFNRALAKALHRPYWLPAPAFLVRKLLGEMSVLITEGRHAEPKRLLEAGYVFQFATLDAALKDLL